jgi:hypothetical protein
VGLFDGLTGGQAYGLERDLRGRVDGEVRFDAGSRGATDGAWFLFLPLNLADGSGAPGRALAVLP